MVILVHSGLAFTCEYCQEEFGNEIKLSRHILKDHDVDKLQCEHCDFETLKQRSLDAHKAAKHRLGFNRREKVNVERRETSFSESQPKILQTCNVRQSSPGDRSLTRDRLGSCEGALESWRLSSCCHVQVCQSLN